MVFSAGRTGSAAVAAPTYREKQWDSWFDFFIRKSCISIKYSVKPEVMKSLNRDLLVLSKNTSPDPRQLEHEVEQLHEILFHVETMRNFCMANELIDMNRYKIIRKPHQIERIVRENTLKPFQFINNKN